MTHARSSIFLGQNMKYVSRLRRASAKGVMDRCRKIRKVVSFDRGRTGTRSIVDQKSERARNDDDKETEFF